MPSFAAGRRRDAPRLVRALAIAAAAVACVWAMGRAYERGSVRPAIDFYQCWMVVHSVRDGHPSVYSAKGREELAQAAVAHASREGTGPLERAALGMNLDLYAGKLEVVGTPALYALSSVFVGDDYEVDRRVFLLAQLAAVSVASVLFALVSGAPGWAGLLFAAWAVSFFEPVISDLVVGSVSSLQWAWLGVVAWLAGARVTAGRDALLGAALGFATTVKPNVALVIVLLLLSLAFDRRARALGATIAGALGAAVATVAVTAAWSGSPGAWLEWLQALPRLASTRATLADGNVGLVAVLRESLHVQAALPLAVLVVAACALLLWRTRGASLDASRDVLFAVSAGGAGTALASNVFWVHYAVLLAPAAFVAWASRRPTWRAAALVAVSAMSSVPRSLFGDRFAVDLLFVVAQATLFVLALAAWWRARSSRQERPPSSGARDGSVRHAVRGRRRARGSGGRRDRLGLRLHVPIVPAPRVVGGRGRLRRRRRRRCRAGGRRRGCRRARSGRGRGRARRRGSRRVRPVRRTTDRV